MLGWVGEIHPEAREAMGIDEVVVAFELDLDKLIKGARNQENYREFSPERVKGSTLARPNAVWYTVTIPKSLTHL